MNVIDIDADGYKAVIIPSGTVDYQSDETEADFIDKDDNVLLTIKSEHKGHAHNVAYKLFKEYKPA